MSNNVMGKIAKLSKESNLELSRELVKLNIVADLKKSNSDLSSTRKKLDDSLSSWYDKLFSLQKDFSSIRKLNSDFEKSLVKVISESSKLKTQAKELGVKAEGIPAYDEAIRDIKRAEDMSSEFTTGSATAKNLI